MLSTKSSLLFEEVVNFVHKSPNYLRKRLEDALAKSMTQLPTASNEEMLAHLKILLKKTNYDIVEKLTQVEDKPW